MILIWNGFGILVPLSFLFSIFLSVLLFRDRGGMVYVIGALLCYLIDILVKKYRTKTCESDILINPKTCKEKVTFYKVRINKRTGQSIKIIVKDTFFGLSIFIWVFIFLIMGIGVFFVSL